VGFDQPLPSPARDGSRQKVAATMLDRKLYDRKSLIQPLPLLRARLPAAERVPPRGGLYAIQVRARKPRPRIADQPAQFTALEVLLQQFLNERFFFSHRRGEEEGEPLMGTDDE
jgi:hypothetical protein